MAGISVHIINVNEDKKAVVGVQAVDNNGEAYGDVVKLKHNNGSTFDIPEGEDITIFEV